MKRIAIIGNSGAGKSYLAIILANELSIPVYHIDKILWKPNWVRTPEKEFIKKHNAIVEKDTWILDGVGYKSTFDYRFEKADAIIFLDVSPEICFENAKKRMQEDILRPNPYVTENCPYSYELKDLQLEVINSFHTEFRPFILEKIARYEKNKKIIHLKGNSDLVELYKLLKEISQI
ncbi:MAG: hypothetical protein FK731_13035 [Asgard group archaeon]|nr:hypothetical protein [Asgard group archaeon]